MERDHAGGRDEGEQEEEDREDAVAAPNAAYEPQEKAGSSEQEPGHQLISWLASEQSSAVSSGVSPFLLWDRPRLERNPAAVYIRRLGSPGSRRAMQAALNTIATEVLGVPRQIRVRSYEDDVSGASASVAPTAMFASRQGGENVTYLCCAWSALRYEHTSAVRDWLAAQLEPGLESGLESGSDPSRGRQPISSARYAPATVNKMLAALRGVLKEAWRLGEMNAEDYHRAADLQNVSATTLPRGRSLTHGELTSLLASCLGDDRYYKQFPKQLPRDARDAALIAMLYSIGLRRFEIVALDLADYDAETGSVHVRHGKRRKARQSFLANGAISAMDDWLAIRGDGPGPLFYRVQKGGVVTGKRLSDQAIYHILQVRQRQAHLSPFSPHDLRRTCVGDLLDAGVDISTAKQIVGHTSVDTTAKYDRRGDRAKKAAADKLHVPYIGRQPAARADSAEGGSED